MSPLDDRPPTAGPPSTALVLPRPNPGPEPWSDPVPGWGPGAWVGGAILALGLLGLAVRRWRRSGRGPAIDPAPLDPTAAADLTPSRRLIASSGPVRAALIAQFGATWGSRTTEEIALDPTLDDRLGAEAARSLVAYLEQVDRAKFAGEEFSDTDEWIEQAHAFLARLSTPTGRRPP